MKNTISTKITKTLILCIFITMSVSGFGYYYFERERRLIRLENITQQTLDRVSYSLDLPMWNFFKKNCERILMLEMANKNIVAIIVFDHKNRFYLGKIRDNSWKIIDYEKIIRTDKRLEKSSFSLKTDILHDNDTVGSVALYVTDRFVKNDLNLLITTIIVQLIFLSAVLLFLIYISLKKLVINPLKFLDDGVKSLKEKKFSKKIPIVSDDEIGDLALSFNHMSETLADSYEQIETQNRELISAHQKLQEYADELKRKNEYIEGQNIALKKADKYKDEFLANASHELRTPMNAIIGLSQTALGDQVPPKLHESLTTILSSARSLLAIINGILDVSRMNKGKLVLDQRDFLLESVLNRIYDEIFSKNQKKELVYRVNIHHNVPNAVTGDDERLYQILHQLVSNAVKFTEKGHVTIDVDVDVDVDVEEALKPNMVVLSFSITDSGIGIAPDQLEDLFQTFIQLDGSTTRKYGGIGLGLTLSQKLIELMGGNISVKSEPGKGSTFMFTVEVWPQPVEKKKPFVLKTAAELDSDTAVDNSEAGAQMAADTEKVPLKKIDKKEVHHIINLLSEAITSNITKAQGHLENLKETMGNTPEINAIENAIDDYDDDEALEHIEKLMKQIGL